MEQDQLKQLVIGQRVAARGCELVAQPVPVAVVVRRFGGVVPRLAGIL